MKPRIFEEALLWKHPDRLRIVQLLARRPLTADELADELELTRSDVWQHLFMFRNHGMLRSEQDEDDGRIVYNEIDWDALAGHIAELQSGLAITDDDIREHYRPSRRGPIRDDALEVLQTLSYPTRLRIAELVRRRAKSTEAIAERLPIRPNSTSVSLRKMREAGVVRMERRGHDVRYVLERDHVAAALAELLRLTPLEPGDLHG